MSVGVNVAAAQFLLTSSLGKEQNPGFWLRLLHIFRKTVFFFFYFWGVSI